MTFMSSSPFTDAFCTGHAVNASIEDWFAVRGRVTAGVRVRNQLRTVAQTEFEEEKNYRLTFSRIYDTNHCPC